MHSVKLSSSNKSRLFSLSIIELFGPLLFVNVPLGPLAAEVETKKNSNGYTGLVLYHLNSNN